MSDIIILDSSDDEESRQFRNKNHGFPVIVNVESIAESTSKKNNRKRFLTKNIGECTLSPIKQIKRSSSYIEISDDSDDNNEEINGKKEIQTQRNISRKSSKDISSRSIRACHLKSYKVEGDVISLIDDSPIKTESDIIENGTEKHQEFLDKALPSNGNSTKNLFKTDMVKPSEDLPEFDSLALRIKSDTQPSANLVSTFENNKLTLPTTSSNQNEEVVSEKNSTTTNVDSPEQIEGEDSDTMIVNDDDPCSDANSNIEPSNSTSSHLTTNSDKSKSLETFEQFLAVCEEADSTDDMKKVISKLKRYYDSAHRDYKESSHFLKLIKQTTKLVKSKQNYYLHIKDFIEELRIRRSQQIETNDTEESLTRDNEDFSERTDDTKQMRIHRLQRAMKQINKILKDLEEKEVDFDDESNSTYILKDRYERRMIKIYNKLCEITGEKPCAGRAIKRKFSIVPSSHTPINKCIQDLVNKKKQFPDYHDILKVIRTCNTEHNLKMSSAAVEYEARTIFERIGTELQRRRQADYYLSISDYLQTETDPATQDPILMSKLTKNHKENSHKIGEIINKYVEKASQLGLKEEEVKTDEEKGSDDENDSDAETKVIDKSSDEDCASISGTTKITKSAQNKDSDNDLEDIYKEAEGPQIDSNKNSPPLVNNEELESQSNSQSANGSLTNGCESILDEHES